MHNLLKMNDWHIKRFFLVVLVLLISFLSIIGLDFLGIKIPILRESIGFIILTFIPGILILRILRIHNLSSIENVLYSVGLSLGFLILMGLFMNILYPIFGVIKPLSTIPLLTTFITLTLIFCLLTYIMDKDFKSFPAKIDLTLLFHPYTLILLLIPFISIFGTYLMNFYSDNILQLLLLFVIAVIPVLIGLDKIPTKLYPMAIFAISISLLFHRMLISNYIHGWDIQLTYYFSELTRTNNYWNPSIGGHNVLLSLSMVSSIYSIFCDLSLHWVYKVFYSFFFSLVPLGLFHVFKNVFNKDFGSKEAIFGAMVFMFYFRFFWDIPGKQQIAELFLVILLMLSIDRKIDIVKKSVLVIIFAFAMIQSHYGVTYIFILSLIFAFIILYVKNIHLKSSILSPNFITLFFTMAIAWYIFTGSGDLFYNLTNISNHIITSISEIFSKIESRTGKDVLFRSFKYGILYNINKFLLIILSFFILTGILKSTVQLLKRETELNKDYGVISIFFCLFLAASFFTAGGLGVDRAYQISLVLLSPFSVVGYKLLLYESKMVINKALNYSLNMNSSSSMKPFSIFLVLLILFNTGFVYYIHGFTLSSNYAIDKNADYPYFNDKEMQGAKWIKFNAESSSEIYADGFGVLLLYEFHSNNGMVKTFLADTKEISENAYIYFRKINVKGEIMNQTGYTSLQNSEFIKVVNNGNKIYANGDAEVYYRESSSVHQTLPLRK